MKVMLKFAFVFLFLSFLVFRPTSSYAYWHGHGYVGVHIGVWPGYYYGGPYYDPYYPYYADPYYAPSYVVSTPTYQPVVVNGVTYYVNNGVYYTYTQYGYQAVATPAGASAPLVETAAVTSVASAGSDDSFTVNIPNSKGGYNTVIIKRSGNGFVGPQGEFYADFPKVSQLQVMYGK